MQVLTAGLDIEGWKRRIAEARERVLMLDYDGTLAPFQVRPELAVPYPEASACLREIVRAGGTRLAIVSGRPAAQVPPLLGLTPHPEIWGAHGRERLHADGRSEMTAPSPEVQALLAEAVRAVEEDVDKDRVEVKLASVAVHWRGSPPDVAERARSAALTKWAPLARDAKLEMLPFDGGIELRATGHTKANAVQAVLAEASDEAAIAYLGDDTTDEDAFRALKPRGLAVLVRPELKETSADVWIKPPQELASFLLLWAVKN